MSKADIENVCTLSALLVMREHTPGNYPSAPKAMHDAMALQQLGRRATRNAERLCNIPDYQARYDLEYDRIHAKASAILKPYGLTAKVTGDPRGYCLRIMGLPGNTWGGNEAGYGV